MTKAQLDALQTYVSATVRIMTEHASAHSQNARLYIDARKALEQAFGVALPKYPDLFGAIHSPQPKSALPDIL